MVSVKDAQGPKGVNEVVVPDPTAPPLWARFYAIETGKPVLADIGYERQNGYAWYGNWPQRLLEVECPAWKKRAATKAER